MLLLFHMEHVNVILRQRIEYKRKYMSHIATQEEQKLFDRVHRMLREELDEAIGGKPIDDTLIEPIKAACNRAFTHLRAAGVPDYVYEES